MIRGDLEIIRRVRQTIGPNIPIGVSLDLHANISAEITELVDAITIYKTYPHLDMADTGARNFDCLNAKLNGARSMVAFSPINYLIQLHAQNTAIKPLSIIRSACDILETNGQVVEIAWGSRPQIPHTLAPVSSCLHQTETRQLKLPDK